MAKETKKGSAPAAGTDDGLAYDELVQRLEAVVQRLEKGELPLEESLKAFEEGIGLVRRGEAKLADAEKRVEQLLAGEGERTEPAAAPARATDRKAPPEMGGDEDIPF